MYNKLTPKPNANNFVLRKLKTTTNKDLIKGLQDNVYSKNRAQFCITMQSFITRLGGILMQTFYESSKDYCSLYYTGIKFICFSVIRNPQLFKLFDTFKINDNGNGVKHTLSNANVYFKECLLIYNQIIDELVSKTRYTSLNVCKLTLQKETTKEEEGPEFKDDPLISLPSNQNYGNSYGVDFEISLSPNYSINLFKKTVVLTLTFKAAERYENRYLTLSIFEDGNSDYLLYNCENYDLGSESDTFYVSLEVPIDHINNRKVSIGCEIAISQKEVTDHWCLDVFKLLDTYDIVEKATMRTYVSTYLDPKNQQS